MSVKQWFGTPPSKCDICDTAITHVFVDGATAMGPWGNMCKKCHFRVGKGLGTGRGQEYTKNESTRKWIKTEG